MPGRGGEMKYEILQEEDLFFVGYLALQTLVQSPFPGTISTG